MVGRPVDAIYPKRTVPLHETVLEVSQLQNAALGLHNIDFSVRSGEILGFAGLVGSGRTELAETLFGIAPTHSMVTVDGSQHKISNPRRAIQLGLGYLPEDRRKHGLIMEMAIAENISIAKPQNVARAGMINRSREDALANDFISRLQIKTASVRTPTLLLSGGNQQKVALARWLAIKPRIMILDEPTQGVDVGSKAEIYEIITSMAESGVAIILISSELSEIIGMCDRVAVFHQRTIVSVFNRSEATPENIMSRAFGHTTSAPAPQ
jgi:ABC-type sugar transport system ATPase subunit